MSAARNFMRKEGAQGPLKRQKKAPFRKERGRTRKTLLRDRAFQLGIVGLADKLRQVGSIIILSFDGIAFLDALGSFSLVDDLLAILFSDYDFLSLLDVEKLHGLSPLLLGLVFKHNFVLTL